MSIKVLIEKKTLGYPEQVLNPLKNFLLVGEVLKERDINMCMTCDNMVEMRVKLFVIGLND